MFPSRNTTPQRDRQRTTRSESAQPNRSRWWRKLTVGLRGGAVWSLGKHRWHMVLHALDHS